MKSAIVTRAAMGWRSTARKRSQRRLQGRESVNQSTRPVRSSTIMLQKKPQKSDFWPALKRPSAGTSSSSLRTYLPSALHHSLSDAVERIWECQTLYIQKTANENSRPTQGCSQREFEPLPPPRTTAIQNSQGDQKARPVNSR